jgi:hypothetical protein
MLLSPDCLQLRSHLCALTAVSCAHLPLRYVCACWRSSQHYQLQAWTHHTLLSSGNSTASSDIGIQMFVTSTGIFKS